MRFILTISLIIIAVIAYNNYNRVEIPQFTEAELEFICIEEGLL